MRGKLSDLRIIESAQCPLHGEMKEVPGLLGICRVQNPGRAEDGEIWGTLGKVGNEAEDSSYICNCLPVRPYKVHVFFFSIVYKEHVVLLKEKTVTLGSRPGRHFFSVLLMRH